MYDIKPLEEEWKKYNKKKRKPYYIVGGLLLGFFVGVGFFLNVREVSLPKLPEFYLTSKDVPQYKTPNNVLLENSLTTLQIKKVEIIEKIKPNVKLTVEDKSEEILPTLPIVESIPVLEDEKQKKVVKKMYKKPAVKLVKKVEKPRKKMHLNIIESSSVSAYKDVEKRFYESRDTDDSLFLAKSYFRKGNYKKAEYWALQTNKVNKNIDDSWLIFAESKVKLGRKNEAIRVLTNYVKMSNSPRAKSLLYKLKNNI